jgi:hypothetical protein
VSTKLSVTFADAGAILCFTCLERPAKTVDEAEDVQATMERLEVAIEADVQLPESQESGEGGDDESAVSLPHRALPVIHLLKAAAKAKCNVMWDRKN